MNSPYFSFSILGFVSGVAVASLFNLSLYTLCFFALISSVLIFFLKRDFFEKKSRFFNFCVLFCLFFVLGFFRFYISEENLNKNFLDEHIDQKISVIGFIDNEVDERENNSKLVLKIKKLEGATLKDQQIKILLTVPHYPEYVYGDEVRVSGYLQEVENFKNELGKEFDYKNYLAKDGIFYLMFYPETELLSKNNGNFIKEKLFVIKKKFLKNLEEHISQPQASLLGGLLLGVKQSLGTKLQDDFRKVGLIHIVVLSGYNVSIIADFIMSVLMFLPRLLALSFGAIGIILFALMVGGSATVVRASLMALFVVLAKATGRTSEVTRALFLAAFIMLLFNPRILIFDPSFQLSFMATLGLIYLSPKLSEYFKFIPEKFYLRESVVATLSTQLFVLPLLLYMMGELSLVAVLVNFLVLVFIPVTMLFGFLTAVFSFAHFSLANIFAFLSYFLLTYILVVVEFFAELPFASIKIVNFPFWLMFVFYLIFFLVFYKKKSNEK